MHNKILGKIEEISCRFCPGYRIMKRTIYNNRVTDELHDNISRQKNSNYSVKEALAGICH